jgi:hypothetical protein
MFCTADVIHRASFRLFIFALLLSVAPALAGSQEIPEVSPPLPAPATEFAVDLPPALMRMTTWKAVGLEYVLVSATEMLRNPVQPAEAPSSSPDTTRRPPAGVHLVQLSDAAIADAERLLVIDTTVQQLLRDRAKARRTSPSHSAALLHDPVTRLESYMLRAANEAPQRVTTAVIERAGRLESLTSVLESRAGTQWWRQAIISRVFDGDGVEAVVISQYGAPRPVP